jgi:hypothetical protein
VVHPVEVLVERGRYCKDLGQLGVGESGALSSCSGSGRQVNQRPFYRPVGLFSLLIDCQVIMGEDLGVIQR